MPKKKNMLSIEAKIKEKIELELNEYNDFLTIIECLQDVEGFVAKMFPVKLGIDKNYTAGTYTRMMKRIMPEKQTGQKILENNNLSFFYKYLISLKKYNHETWEKLKVKMNEKGIDWDSTEKIWNDVIKNINLNIQPRMNRLNFLADTYHCIFPKTSKGDSSLITYNKGLLQINKENNEAVFNLFVIKKNEDSVNKIYKGKITCKTGFGDGYDNIHIVMNGTGDNNENDISYIQFSLHNIKPKEDGNKYDFAVALVLTSCCGDPSRTHFQTVHRMAMITEENYKKIDADKNYTMLKNGEKVNTFIKNTVLPLLRLGEERFIIEADKFNEILKQKDYGNELEKELTGLKKSVYIIPKTEILSRLKTIKGDNNEARIENAKLIQELREKNELGTLQYDRIESNTQEDIRDIIYSCIQERD